MPSYEHRTETVFTWGAPPLKFGPGAISELGDDIRSLGVNRVLLITDPQLATTAIIEDAVRAIRTAGLKAAVYDGVAVEPTDVSVQGAASSAAEDDWDGYVAVGGGSSIDTAKAVNLLTTQPGTLLDYVAPPIGGGRVPERPMKPLIAVPTTSGTGSESTTICVVDLLDRKVKAAVSHRALRPLLAVVDPLATLSVPPAVTAATGMDVLTHAVESYTAKRFDARPAFANSDARTSFCGANPISDVWCEIAMRKVGAFLRRAVHNGDDLEARWQMAFASMVTGMGFGNAGTHIPHANSYPIAGSVRHYRADDYPSMPMVPHGQAVASTAMAAFRYTYPANPERHLRAATLIAGHAIDVNPAAEALPTALRDLSRDIGMPNGIGDFGYGEADLAALVDGAFKQSRQLSVTPRRLTREAAMEIFRQSLRNW